MGDDGIRLQLNEIEPRRSSLRQTPITSFGERFKTGLVATTTAVGNMAASAGYHIPATAVLGAAITGVGTVRDICGGPTSGPSMGDGLAGNLGLGSTGGVPGGSFAGNGVMGSVASNAAAGDKSSQLMLATQQMQEMNQTFNLQYLQLQQRMQNESRQFTAVSNVMKTKHDTARNALSNLK